MKKIDTKKNLKRAKKVTKIGVKKTKQAAHFLKNKTKQGLKKTQQVYHSPTGKKVREWVKKTTKVIGSHLATIKMGVTLSNEESNLLTDLQVNLNKKGIYPSKSEILRAGLWNLRKMNSKQLEESLKELIKVKQSRIL